MKFLVAFACLVAVAYAVEDNSVIRQILDVQPDKYAYDYALGNGVSAQESGSLDGEGIVAKGSYEYTAPDGQKITESYIADKNGFQPSGPHLPQIPILIQRALEYLGSHQAYVDKKN